MHLVQQITIVNILFLLHRDMGNINTIFKTEIKILGNLVTLKITTSGEMGRDVSS